MEQTIVIDTQTFDFDFWTRNKVNILRIIDTKKTVEDIRTLSLLAGLSYATTHDIFTQLETCGFIIREGRTIRLAENWLESFRKGVCIASDDT
jgi:hypothetical protein